MQPTDPSGETLGLGVSPDEAVLTPVQDTTPPAKAMTQREVALAMIALIASMFVAMLSNLVLLTAMPRITAELHATQAHYTWIVTSSMLTIAVCTPIWGRISDQLNKKLLMQICVAGYVVSSFIASLAPNPILIIICRIGIGICAAGMIVLMQTISVAIMSARERARWIGYRAAAMSVATVGAPSLGGLITEHIGWRACFLVGIPFAIMSIILLQRTLHLPPPDRRVKAKIDWLGALLLGTGIVLMMIWVSIAGPNEGWASSTALGVLAAGIAVLVVSVLVELRVSLPILPLELFRQKEVLLCVVASAGAGVGFFCSAVFLAQYLQIGRGLGPSAAGLMALPEAAGSLIASLLTARVISRHGHYKPTLMVGSLILLAGFVLLATLGATTPYVLVGLYVALVGAGLGVTGETLTIVVQNAVRRGTAGTAGALVAFFRVMGGVVGVAALGTILSGRVGGEMIAAGFPHYDPHSIPQIWKLSGPLRAAVQAAYVHGASLVYLICVPVALIMLIAMYLLPAGSLSDESPLEAAKA
ncbi:MDR family MFS transporter [soil metagenome]